MNLAIVADWLTTKGGAEQVIREFTALFPDAPLYTTVARRGFFAPQEGKRVTVSGLQSWFRLLKRHQPLLLWMPRAVEEMDLRGFDVILSSSHAVAKGIIPPSNALHICYCHTPMRYAWEMEDEYLRDFRIPRILIPLAKRQLKQLRRWDMTTAKRVDVFLANSSTTQERIRRIYGRESVVIPPPVADHFFTVPLAPSVQHPAHTPYFLAAGRFVPYKRFDLLIEVANTRKLPLKIAGRGQDDERLRNMAGPTVEFLGFVPDEDLAKLYAGAEALLFPQVEDAGLVLLEAQACGTPVIAFHAGGAQDAVVENKTGIFFDAQTVESVTQAIDRFHTMRFDRSAIREHARRFSREAFRERMRGEIELRVKS